MLRFASALVVTALAACSGSPGGPTMNSKMDDSTAYRSPVVSWDILDREPLANKVQVKHILIGWKDLGDAYGGRLDQRAAARSRADAETQVKTLVDQIKGGGDFDALMKQHSEDEGSAQSGTPFEVSPDAKLVIEFRQLSLRLNVNEVGVCQSDYGYHIIKRLN